MNVQGRLLAAVVVSLCAGAGAEEPREIGDRKQLFIDRRMIARSERIELRLNPPQKLGPLRDPQGQLLRGHVGRVFEYQGKVRLYLGAEHVQVWESSDGLRFTQIGSLPGGGIFPTIFFDEHDPDPSRRFKLFRLLVKSPFDRQTDGVYASTSSDGVTFTGDRRVLPFFTDNPTIVLWDGRLQKYVVYVRALAYDSENQRRIARLEMDDPLQPWPFVKGDEDQRPTPFLSTANVKVVLQADEQDDPHSDVYYNAATPYPGAEDVHLMFTSQFRHFAPSRNPYVRPRVAGQWEDYGMLEVQLAVSRDGIQWQRPSRDPYVAGGLPDEWDRWYTVMGPGLARRGSALYQYYSATGRLHDSALLRPEFEKTAPQEGGVGVVKQRLDGFLSADADHQGGRFETPLVTFRGRHLRLNVDTGAMGTALVEIRNAENQPLPGYSFADCEEIVGNFIDQKVAWKGNDDVSSLAGKPVRLHFRIRRCKLYAFQFTQS